MKIIMSFDWKIFEYFKYLVPLARGLPLNIILDFHTHLEIAVYRNKIFTLL